MKESAEEEGPAKGPEQEWTKKFVENLECYNMEAKNSICSRKCSNDLNVQRIKSDKVRKEPTGFSNMEVNGGPGEGRWQWKPARGRVRTEWVGNRALGADSKKAYYGKE